MKTVSRAVPTFFICSITCLLASGCLGPKVLTETVVHVPASDPRVELRLKTNAPADVLVVYDDLDANSYKIERRAFYLFANEDRLLRGQRPHYAKLSEAEYLKAVPLLQCPPEDVAAVTNELYGFELSSRRYRLESHGKLLAAFELPQYERWFTAKKLFLFPAAVGADAVGGPAMAGAYIANDPQLAGAVAPLAEVAAQAAVGAATRKH